MWVMAADDFDVAGRSDKNFPQNFQPLSIAPDRKLTKSLSKMDTSDSSK